MKPKRNIWSNDIGFLWMLAISVLSLISTQITLGALGESKFTIRFGFFLFTLLAVQGASLSAIGKSVGYIIASILLVLAAVLIWVDSQPLTFVYSLLTTGYMIFIITLVVNQIFKGEVVTVYKVGGSVAVYILIGQLWASLYMTVYILDPAAFLYGGEAILKEASLKHLSYFSFVTLTTIGYGDIVAMSPVARVLVMMEGLLGQLFPAIFIAKVVSLHIGTTGKK